MSKLLKGPWSSICGSKHTTKNCYGCLLGKIRNEPNFQRMYREHKHIEALTVHVFRTRKTWLHYAVNLYHIISCFFNFRCLLLVYLKQKGSMPGAYSCYNNNDFTALYLLIIRSKIIIFHWDNWINWLSMMHDTWFVSLSITWLCIIISIRKVLWSITSNSLFHWFWQCWCGWRRTGVDVTSNFTPQVIYLCCFIFMAIWNPCPWKRWGLHNKHEKMNALYY